VERVGFLRCIESRMLSKPIRIGRVLINNSIAMAPIAIAWLVNPDGTLTQRAMDHYGSKIFIQLTAGYGRPISGASIASGVKLASASRFSLP
jgi:hypothetical protein